jgi:hypothetical protein
MDTEMGAETVQVEEGVTKQGRRVFGW